MQNVSSRAQMRKLLIAVVCLLAIAALGWWLWEKFSPPKPFGKVVTLAGTGAKIGAQQTISDPFGIAADGDDIYVTDGLGGSLYRVMLKGKVELITNQLDMPSHLAVAPDGNLIIANTGAHTIVKVDPKSGQVSVIAGTPNVSGDADGKGTEAKFNAPIGVAVDKQGLIYVADTYNDRIRAIEKDGTVKTIAGSTKGNLDGQGKNAQFDSPCSLAVWGDAELLVADTGNNTIRLVRADGTVQTQQFRQELSDSTGVTSINPQAILTYGASELYFLDANGNIFFVKIGQQKAKRGPTQILYDDLVLYAVAKVQGAGLTDGDLTEARFNRPTALTLVGKNTLVVADSGNGLVRAIVPSNANLGAKSDPAIATIKAEEIRKAVPPRWPFDPPDAKREIAGTLGEVRGEIAPEKDAWFHNGFDIPGAYGEQVRAQFSERVTLPLAVEGVGNLRERLRLPLIGYIHVRIGRDQNDQPLGIKEAIFQRDDKGKVIGVRVPRGTRINVGDVVGTLNAFNHVHLIAGPSAAEVNALAALELPGLVDTIAPIVEAVRVRNEQGDLKAEPGKPIQVSGKIQFIVRAYDQADGNAGYRRLGVYQVGYQVLGKDGIPLPDFKEPRFNIVFNRLPEDWQAVRLAYAEPSQSGYTGRTIFDYIATNWVRDGAAREDWLDSTRFANGEYILRAVVEDFFRNRTVKDLRMIVAN